MGATDRRSDGMPVPTHYTGARKAAFILQMWQVQACSRQSWFLLQPQLQSRPNNANARSDDAGSQSASAHEDLLELQRCGLKDVWEPSAATAIDQECCHAHEWPDLRATDALSPSLHFAVTPASFVPDTERLLAVAPRSSAGGNRDGDEVHSSRANAVALRATSEWPACRLAYRDAGSAVGTRWQGA